MPRTRENCPDCGTQMQEKGETGAAVSVLNNRGESTGIKEVIIYQCPECKTIKVV